MKLQLRLILSLVVLCCLFTFSQSAYCSGTPDAGERTNTQPLSPANLVMRKEVKNARLYEAGPKNARFQILHVWGTPYEKGLAQGEILKDDINRFVYGTMSYLANAIVSSLSGKLPIPEWAKEMLIVKGIFFALDWTASVTKAFTPQAYFDEIQGIADGAGVSRDLLWRLQMFPEVTKASCSFFGAWGSAVNKAMGGALQLRALDYDVDGPFKDHPLVTVYHPDGSNPKEQAFAQVGFPATVGVLTGYSEASLAISEIGVAFPDESFKQGVPGTLPEVVHGKPWMFVLRDALQMSSSLSEAKESITNDKRTCNLIIGLGGGKEQQVYGIEYSGRLQPPNFYQDTNLLPVNETWHPQVDNVVYNGMDWLCPGFNQKLGEQLQKYHGSIDAVTTIQNILPTVQTGNLHIAVTEITNQVMHVSFARGKDADPSEPLNAYQRQFTTLNMKELFAEQKPSV